MYKRQVINQEWVEKVKAGKENKISNEIYNEQIAMYFLFKYFLLAVYDYDVLSKIKMAVIGVLIVTYFGEESLSLIHIYLFKFTL